MALAVEGERAWRWPHRPDRSTTHAAVYDGRGWKGSLPASSTSTPISRDLERASRDFGFPTRAADCPPNTSFRGRRNLMVRSRVERSRPSLPRLWETPEPVIPRLAWRERVACVFAYSVPPGEWAGRFSQGLSRSRSPRSHDAPNEGCSHQRPVHQAGAVGFGSPCSDRRLAETSSPELRRASAPSREHGPRVPRPHCPISAPIDIIGRAHASAPAFSSSKASSGRGCSRRTAYVTRRTALLGRPVPACATAEWPRPRCQPPIPALRASGCPIATAGQQHQRLFE